MAFNILGKLRLRRKKELKAKKIIAFSSLAALLVLLARRTIIGSEFRYDTFLSIISALIVYFNYRKMNMNYLSYFFFNFALILHNIGLYTTSPFGVRFDHYMHFTAGFTMAMMSERVFPEKSAIKRWIILIFIPLGIGALGEMLEWLGYGILGSGDGFFFYGMGDEGEWRNSILDMIFNFFGALLFLIIRLL